MEPVPTKRSDVVLQRVEQDVILLDQREGKAHVLNASAARVWEMIDGSATVEDVATALGVMYGLPATAVRDDVAGILQTFRELSLIEQASS